MSSFSPSIPRTTTRLYTIKDLEENPGVIKTLEDWDVVDELNRWLVQHRYGPENRWTSTIKWGEDRKTGVFHPSSIASKACDMYLYLEKKGVGGKRRHSAEQIGTFDTGTVIHTQLQYYQHIKARQEKCEYLEEISTGLSPEARELCLDGNVDGFSQRRLEIGDHKVDLRCLWEYKTIKTENFTKLRNKPDIGYVRQVHSYMVGTGVPLTILLYYNKNLSLKRAFKVYFDPEVWAPIRARLERILEHEKEGRDPERRVTNSCRYCPYFEPCRPPGQQAKPRFRR